MQPLIRRHGVALPVALSATLAAGLFLALPEAQPVATGPRLPTLPFVANAGQVPNAAVAWYTTTAHGPSYVTHDGAIVYELPERAGTGWVLTERLVDATRRTPHASGLLPTVVNYFSGKDPSRWRARLPTYAALEWGEVYPGVSLALQRREASLEKIFTVSAHADPTAIRLAFDGAERLDVLDSGELAVQTANGPVRFSRPIAWQDVDGERRSVAVRYAVSGHAYGFALGAYDRSRPLVIDPLLASTYVGGDHVEPYSQVDLPIARNPTTGAVYLAGTSSSSDFPATAGAYRTTRGTPCGIFVAKFSDDLTTLDAMTFLGGSGCDSAQAIAVDASGNVYVAGAANSSDFPTTAGAYDTSDGYLTDAYVAKLGADLDSLLAATLLTDTSATQSQNGSERIGTMVLDGAGSVYVAGGTTSASFPTTPGAYQSTNTANDAFIARFSDDLTTLQAATLYGTGGGDNYTESVTGMALDSSGNVYIAGFASHTNLPVTVNGATAAGGNDAFIAKLNGTLTTLGAARYLGGSGQDVAYAVTMDAADALYLVGYTSSGNFPASSGAADTSANGFDDVFVAKLDASLGLTAATYLGGTFNDAAQAVAMDGAGPVVAGRTSSSNFPLSADAYNSSHGNGDAFVTKLAADLTAITASTFFGGQSGEQALAVLSDGAGNLIISGAVGDNFTPSLDVTEGAYDSTFGGFSDAFLAVLTNDLAGQGNVGVTPPSRNFGTLTLPAAAFPVQAFTVANSGDGYLRITSTTKAGTDSSDFTILNNTCLGARLKPANVLPAEERDCTFDVRFNPTSPGAKSASVQIASTDPDTPVATIPLSGTAASASGGGGGGGGGDDDGDGSGGGGGGASSLATLLALLWLRLVFARRARR